MIQASSNGTFAFALDLAPLGCRQVVDHLDVEPRRAGEAPTLITSICPPQPGWHTPATI
jgi:hypothetical protein